jgi:orotate phosphoribosyltransferase-like protein
MATYRICRFLLLILAITALPVGANDADWETFGARIDELEKNAMDSQAATLDVIGSVADNLSQKIAEKKQNILVDGEINEDLSISMSTVADIEKTREKLKQDVKEWTELLEYVELDEIKKGVDDALSVAEADGLDIEKLKKLYDLTRAIIRKTQFRTAGLTVSEKMQNIDLDRAEIDRRLEELRLKREMIQKELDNTSSIHFLARESLRMDLCAVDAEIIQHQLNIRHEDVSKPLGILMDGILAGMVSLNRLTDQGRKNIKAAGFENYGFDWGAPRELAEQYTMKLITLGFEGEALAAEAAAARQKHRKNFYKRSTVAFIRALISGKDHCPGCQVEEMRPVTIEYKGEKVRVLGCPDPVVANLRAYLDAFRKFQDAESDRAIAEGEQLIAEQQIIADAMAVVPLVGDALDIYSVYAGENLAGVKLSPVERCLVGVLAALPIVGPSAVQQALKRSESLQNTFPRVAEFMLEAEDLIAKADQASNAVEKNVLEEYLKFFAKKMGIEADQLKRLTSFFRETPYVLDDAARARMKLFKTMRDGAEDRIVYNMLAGSDEFSDILKKAKKESDDLLEDILHNQGRGNFNSYVPKSHKEAFEAVAREEQKVVILRPVGRDAAELLANNAAGTKPLNIKPKSANWGPHKAYIPVEQKFSKLGNPELEIDWDEIAKYNDKSKKCGANKVPLEVKLDSGKMDVVIVKKGGKEIPVYRDSGGSIIDPDTMKPFKSGEVDTSELRPMIVFADEFENPLTADYDALAVGSRREVTPAGPRHGAGFDTASRQQAPRGAGLQGTITEEIDQLVDHLNEAGRKQGGYEKGKLIHHGPETFNPASEGVFTKSELNEGLALTVFDPDYGELAIPACGEACMKNWCESTGLCDPAKICSKGKTSFCIPPDPDRLLKNYMHNARLRGIDISPHSSWNWGAWGPGGWTQTDFLTVPAEVAESAPKHIQKALKTNWEGKVANSIFGAITTISSATVTGKKDAER